VGDMGIVGSFNRDHGTVRGLTSFALPMVSGWGRGRIFGGEKGGSKATGLEPLRSVMACGPIEWEKSDGRAGTDDRWGVAKKEDFFALLTHDSRPKEEEHCCRRRSCFVLSFRRLEKKMNHSAATCDGLGESKADIAGY